jgi:hypothetical protein
MRKKQILSCILVSLLVMMAVPAVLAHTHIELPNGDCVTIPGNAYLPNGADNPGNAAEHSHDGINNAKGGSAFPPPDGTPPDHGNADAPPLQGGLCD